MSRALTLTDAIYIGSRYKTLLDAAERDKAEAVNEQWLSRFGYQEQQDKLHSPELSLQDRRELLKIESDMTVTPDDLQLENYALAEALEAKRGLAESLASGPGKRRRMLSSRLPIRSQQITQKLRSQVVKEAEEGLEGRPPIHGLSTRKIAEIYRDFLLISEGNISTNICYIMDI